MAPSPAVAASEGSSTTKTAWSTPASWISWKGQSRSRAKTVAWSGELVVQLRAQVELHQTVLAQGGLQPAPRGLQGEPTTAGELAVDDEAGQGAGAVAQGAGLAV